MIEFSQNKSAFFSPNLFKELTSLIEYLFNTTHLRSFAYKFWLIHPISSLTALLFRSSDNIESSIDNEFLRLSIEKSRLNEIFTINPSLIDFYIEANLSIEEKTSMIDQLQTNDEFLFKLAQFYLHKENYSSFISFGLIIDTIQKYFLK